MLTRSFDISSATLQDLFTIRAESPAIWAMVQSGLGHLNDYPVVIAPPGVYPCLVPVDLEQETYGQSIDAGAAVQRMMEDELGGRLQLLAIYFQPAIDGGKYNYDRVADAGLVLRWLPTDVAIAVSNHFLNELARINTAVASSMQPIPYTREEEKAGIQELEAFGPFATLHNLSRSNGKSVSWWVKQPWAYVNTYLRMENKKAMVQHKLQKQLNAQTA